ncbi:MAG TPA: hypothetical protein ENN73_06820 [Firmicutes bacterium]|nr:hypothetical protein [Bacillota bacterium]
MNDIKLAEIKEELAPGWSMALEGEYLVFRGEMDVWVLDENNINAPMNLETPEERENRIKEFGKKTKPELKYKLGKKWTDSEVKEAEEKNALIYDKIDALPEKHDILHLFNRFASGKGSTVLTGDTPEENERIEKYYNEKVELEKELADIPDMQTENYSITFSEAVGWTYDFSTVFPNKVSEEVWTVWNLVNDKCRVQRHQ